MQLECGCCNCGWFWMIILVIVHPQSLIAPRDRYDASFPYILAALMKSRSLTSGFLEACCEWDFAPGAGRMVAVNSESVQRLDWLMPKMEQPTGLGTWTTHHRNFMSLSTFLREHMCICRYVHAYIHMQIYAYVYAKNVFSRAETNIEGESSFNVDHDSQGFYSLSLLVKVLRPRVHLCIKQNKHERTHLVFAIAQFPHFYLVWAYSHDCSWLSLIVGDIIDILIMFIHHMLEFSLWVRVFSHMPAADMKARIEHVKTTYAMYVLSTPRRQLLLSLSRPNCFESWGDEEHHRLCKCIWNCTSSRLGWREDRGKNIDFHLLHVAVSGAGCIGGFRTPQSPSISLSTMIICPLPTSRGFGVVKMHRWIYFTGIFAHVRENRCKDVYGYVHICIWPSEVHAGWWGFPSCLAARVMNCTHGSILSIFEHRQTLPKWMVDSNRVLDSWFEDVLRFRSHFTSSVMPT